MLNYTSRTNKTNVSQSWNARTGRYPRVAKLILRLFSLTDAEDRASQAGSLTPGGVRCAMAMMGPMGMGKGSGNGPHDRRLHPPREYHLGALRHNFESIRTVRRRDIIN